jgi:hypothetical protein
MVDDPGAMGVSPSDGALLAALAVVLEEDEQVPADAVDAAIASFTWQSIDADLLELLYDSAREPAPATRGEDSTARLLTFTLPHLVVEMELSMERSWLVRGTISPVRRYAVELQQGSDRVAGESSDAGLFELAAIDTRPLRVIIETDPAGGRFVTPWIDLTDR